MRKSHKKLAPVYAYPHAYTQIRDRGGLLGPPTLNRVNTSDTLVTGMSLRGGGNGWKRENVFILATLQGSFFDQPEKPELCSPLLLLGQNLL